MKYPLVCFAEGRGDQWEALCLDLDIAVTGSSLEEVRRGLNDCIRTYIEDAKAEAPAQRDRLLNRRAPFSVRAGKVLQFVAASLLTRKPENRESASFTLPCNA